MAVSNIYEVIYGQFFNATVKVVDVKFVAIARYVQKPVAIAFILYIAIYGWMILRGQVQEPVSELLRRGFKITIIWFLLLYPGYFHNNFGNLFLTLIPNEIIGEITYGAAGNNSIDKFLNFGVQIANHIRENASWYEIGSMITAWFVEVIAVLSSVAAFFIFVLSDMIVAMLLILAPIFLALLLFEVTSRWFWSWVSSLMTFMLVKILLAVLLALLIQIAQTITRDTINTIQAVTGAFNIIVVFMVGFFIFLKLYDIASAISGGVSVSMGQFGQSLRSSATGAARGISSGTRSYYSASMRAGEMLGRGINRILNR